jgi:flagellar basal-body rod protein FlgG
MQESMFSGLFGALTNEYRMANIANNLANINTAGYKRDVISFKDTFRMFAHDVVMEPVNNIRSKKLFPDPQHMARPRIATVKTDHSQGALKLTGNPLDVAITGEGFFTFVINGENFYSRNGHFIVNAEGTLVTPQGYTVAGAGGAELVIPPGITNVHIAHDGFIYADNEPVGQIQVTTVDDLTALQKVGQNLYRIRENSGAAEVEIPEGTTLQQGYIETANVEVVYEMVNMIEAQRQFEAYQKVMQTSDTLDREAITKIGRSR